MESPRGSKSFEEAMLTHLSLNLSGGIFNKKEEILAFFFNLLLVFNAYVPNP
jgi:hypothetical protein